MALRWLAEFLNFAHEVMVPFTPRLIPAILPYLAHHVSMIQSAAIRTNKLLLNVIQKLPSPVESPLPKPAAEKPVPSSKIPRSPTPTNSSIATSRQSTLSSQISKEGSLPESPLEGGQATQQSQTLQRTRGSNGDLSLTPRAAPAAEILPPNPSSSRPHSPLSFNSQSGVNGNMANSIIPEDSDLFDYQVTVNELTVQFLSEFEETRVAALKWLIMLHQKAPKKVSLRPLLVTGAARTNLIRF